MWGIVPAAGAGSRIQPLAFSKELLPVGGRADGNLERPRAVSEYIVERMLLGGVSKICFVISRAKSDILEYYGAAAGAAKLCYVVQPQPAGLCDAIFQALPLVQPHEPVVIGLPDTIWFPEDGLRMLPDDALSFLLFPRGAAGIVRCRPDRRRRRGAGDQGETERSRLSLGLGRV
jgi:glucose-1-phosphate thymidylyltransferase